MLSINLKGKRAFIAGVGDDQGYGFAIAKALAEAGCEILIGTWTPLLNIFETSWKSGKYDESRRLKNGELLQIKKVYPLDAAFDKPEDVPQEILDNKRYKDVTHYTISEVASEIAKDFGSIDILIHSLANAPEIRKPLLETSRKGYLDALSASSYSMVSLLSHFLPYMNEGGSALTLTYFASEKVIPGYGGGMSSAKAALESDTRVLAFEAGRAKKIRVNAISGGSFRTRAARAIGFIDNMINYTKENSPLQNDLEGEDVANTAAFLVSPLAKAITGSVIFVDCGINTMGVALDSPCLSQKI